MYYIVSKTYKLKRVCLLKFNDEFTYENSKDAILEFKNNGDNNLKGIIYGNIENENAIIYESDIEYISHSISKIKIKPKSGVYGTIEFLTTPKAKILCNILIKYGVEQLVIVTKLQKTNNIIHKISKFNCRIKYTE